MGREEAYQYTGVMVVHTLVSCEVSSRELQLIGSAVHFAKRQTGQAHQINRSQDHGIMLAIETRIPNAQLRGKLELSCREAEVLLLALDTFGNTFRSGTKHQLLLQELNSLTIHLADFMEGHKARMVGMQLSVNKSTPYF